MSVISSGTTATTTLKMTGDTNGVLDLQVGDSGAGGTTAIYINANGQPDFGYPTGQRILGDFASATVANRTMFQHRGALASTGVYAVPSATSGNASWQAANASDPTNASKILIATNGSTDVQLVSGVNGTGTYLPLSIFNGGLGRFVFGTSGQFGIGPVASVSYGTSGQALLSGGASAAPSWGSVSPIPSIEVFTTGTSATWTIPTGVTKVKITVIGGGGGGAGTYGGGGGGGGGSIKVLTGLTPGNTLTYSVGAAGANLGNGGTSQVSSGTQTITTISATGGTAGSSVGGIGGIGSNGDLNFAGNSGALGAPTDGQTAAGGGSFFGGAGGATNTNPGVNGRAYGGGGSSSSGGTGSTGGVGVIIFEY